MEKHELCMRKVKAAKELIDNEIKEIVVLEVRIKSREEGIKTLPDNAEKKIQTERKQAEIERFKEDLFGKHENIKNLELMTEEYQKELQKK